MLLHNTKLLRATYTVLILIILYQYLFLIHYLWISPRKTAGARISLHTGPESDISYPRDGENLVSGDTHPLPINQENIIYVDASEIEDGSPGDGQNVSSMKTSDNGAQAGLKNVRSVDASEWEDEPIKTWTLSALSSSLSGKSRLDLQLTVRTLVLFAANQVNQELLPYPRCVKRWANPLTASNVSSKQLSASTTQWKVRFDLEPGRVPYEAVIRQEDLTGKPINLNLQEELALVSMKRLGLGQAGYETNCEYTDALNLTTQNCICENSLETNKTAVVRSQWNTTDVELNTWPMDSPFFVSSYMNYSNEDFFRFFPGKLHNRDTKASYCGPEVKMLVLISTAPSHFGKRMAIRAAYGNKYILRLGVKVLFFVGTILHDAFQGLLSQEAWINDDMVQADFVDSYQNLTLKHLSMYNWIYLTCRKGHSREMPIWLLKADDDYLLNIDLALKVAEANPEADFIGSLYCGTEPVRNLTFYHNWYIPKYMYLADNYFGYLSGAAYLVRTELIPRLLQASLTVPILQVDDVYVTGLLARQIGAYPQNSALFSTQDEMSTDACLIKSRVITFFVGIKDMQEQWPKLYKFLPSTVNCSLPTDFVAEYLTAATRKLCFYN